MELVLSCPVCKNAPEHVNDHVPYGLGRMQITTVLRRSGRQLTYFIKQPCWIDVGEGLHCAWRTDASIPSVLTCGRNLTR